MNPTFTITMEPTVHSYVPKAGAGTARRKAREAEARKREAERVKDAAPAKISRQRRRFYERKGR